MKETQSYPSMFANTLVDEWFAQHGQSCLSKCSRTASEPHVVSDDESDFGTDASSDTSGPETQIQIKAEEPASWASLVAEESSDDEALQAYK